MKREICLPRPSRVDVASLETLGTKWLSTDLEEDPRITRTTIDEVGWVLVDTRGGLMVIEKHNAEKNWGPGDNQDQNNQAAEEVDEYD